MERWEPVGNVIDIQSEVNRLFDSFFGRPATLATGERQWVPAIDLLETKDDLRVAAELPGVSEKDVTVSITGDVLMVKGERRFDREVKGETFYRLERAYGSFERAVPLPMPVQADKVKATYREGVLEIRLPKAEEVKPKQIKIDIL
ncbi:MAG: Hsp20/alpha crystallin family protein [Candidatus Rokubacteria bacterium]|nr:Hsp20/alpha crystallin family protein [Candidatus Rokubacteria bacterium]